MMAMTDGPGLDTAPARGEGLRVLVVEDYDDTAASTASLLRLEGHQVRTAPDGPAALEGAAADPPDVVLLDLGLPGMDGWEVARRLRDQAGAKSPLFIAVTGYGREEDRLHSWQAGIDLHLTKPVEPELLCQLLRQFQAVLRG